MNTWKMNVYNMNMIFVLKKKNWIFRERERERERKRERKREYVSEQVRRKWDKQ